MTIYWGDGTSTATHPTGITTASGTWTPAPNWGSANSSSGFYKRQGDICFAWGYAQWMSSNNSSAMRINGLPYSADGDQACGSLATQYNDDAGQNLCCFISNNDNYFYVRKSDSGSWSYLTYHDMGSDNKFYWQLCYRI